ncbi:7164_t:CDS:1, partial [Cetraspora pellucida]
PEKVLNMSKLRASMLYQNQIKKIQNDIKFVNSNIAPPICQNNELEEDIELDSESSKDYISNVRKWSEILETWLSMVEDEEDSSLWYDDNSDITNDFTTNQIVFNTTHPADNQSAKWKLEGLFVSDIVASHYIEESKKHEILRKEKEIEFTRNKTNKTVKVIMEDSIESSTDSNSDES